jgi:hypothetical protein
MLRGSSSISTQEHKIIEEIKRKGRLPVQGRPVTTNARVDQDHLQGMNH